MKNRNEKRGEESVFPLVGWKKVRGFQITTNLLTNLFGFLFYYPAALSSTATLL